MVLAPRLPRGHNKSIAVNHNENFEDLLLGLLIVIFGKIKLVEPLYSF